MKLLWWLVGAQGAIDRADDNALNATIGYKNKLNDEYEVIQKLSELRISCAELKGRNCKLLTQLSDCTNEVDKLRKGYRQLSSGAKDLGEKLGDATRENGGLVKQLEDSEATVERLRYSNEKLSGQLSIERGKHKAASKHLYSANTANEALQEQVDNLEYGLSNANSALDDISTKAIDEQATQNTINIGDVVRLKSGGQDMTVNGSHGDAEVFVCVWMRDNKAMEDTFHADTLELVESEPSECGQSELVSANRKYAAFAGEHCYPAGGADDLIGVYNSVKLARIAVGTQDWGNVMDMSSGGIVYSTKSENDDEPDAEPNDEIDEIINDAETTLKANLDTRYHLFGWEAKRGSAGGYNDFIQSYSTPHKAEEALKDTAYSEGQVFDSEIGTLYSYCAGSVWHTIVIFSDESIYENTTSTNEEKAV